MARASLSQLVPSNVTDTFLPLIFSCNCVCSCWWRNGTRSNKLLLSVSRYALCSSKSLKQSILFKGTPAYRKAWTTLKWNTRCASGKVSLTKWISSLCFCNAFAISFLLSFAASFTFLSLCLKHLTWLLILMRFRLNSSRYALQNNFPAETVNGSLLYSCTRCWAVTFLGSDNELPRILRRCPMGGLLATFCFLEEFDFEVLSTLVIDFLQAFGYLLMTI